MCPANNKPIAAVAQGNVKNYEECIEEAQKAWEIWADVSVLNKYLTSKSSNKILNDGLLIRLDSSSKAWRDRSSNRRFSQKVPRAIRKIGMLK